MDIMLYSTANTTIRNMFFWQIFIIVTTLFDLTLGCHSKGKQKAKKEKIIDCGFKNE